MFPSLATLTHWKFSMSIIKFNVWVSLKRVTLKEPRALCVVFEILTVSVVIDNNREPDIFLNSGGQSVSGSLATGPRWRFFNYMRYILWLKQYVYLPAGINAAINEWLFGDGPNLPNPKALENVFSITRYKNCSQHIIKTLKSNFVLFVNLQSLE